MKKAISIVMTVLLLLPLGACSLGDAIDTLLWAFEDSDGEKMTYVVIDPTDQPSDMETTDGAEIPDEVNVGGSETAASLGTGSSQASDGGDEQARQECLDAAALYEQELEPDDEFYGINLSDSDFADIVSILGGAGLTATDANQNCAMTNSGAVDNFFNNGKAGTLCIYELHYDGGLTRHELTANSVRLTRLTWRMGEAVVTYSVKYSLTRLDYSNGRLYYEYFMPDNPEGSSHDGHVDTSKSFSVK